MATLGADRHWEYIANPATWPVEPRPPHYTGLKTPKPQVEVAKGWHAMDDPNRARQIITIGKLEVIQILVVRGISVDPRYPKNFNPGGHVYVVVGVLGAPKTWVVIHVDGFNNYPFILEGKQALLDLLSYEGKRVLSTVQIRLPDPDAAHAWLQKIIFEVWQWMVLPNNCVRLPELLVEKGGLKKSFNMVTNIPALERRGRP